LTDVLTQSLVDEALVISTACAVDLVAEPSEDFVIGAALQDALAKRRILDAQELAAAPIEASAEVGVVVSA